MSNYVLLPSALSRAGLKVLHVDKAEEYGGGWNTLNIASFESWATARTMCSAKDLTTLRIL